ncbi:MAG TPA: tRNA pseudouridine(38-40) synthase TruA [Gemmatimonadaceae bacterium]|nr:tRNA pseudouridine(38-40) synthase TruA [Gemmatimonadaceae bacterium]
MAEHSVQLVLHYDGADFAGWQRQPETRTVQGVLEASLTRLCNRETKAIGAGRTDAGVHARGQAVGTMVPESWSSARLRRALNAILPNDVWVAAAYDMAPEFHARYDAVSRRYSYRIGTDDASRSPFRRRYEWWIEDRLDRTVLRDAAQAIRGEHCFRAYAVQGTAPETDTHRCDIADAHWCDAGDGTALVFEIEANRFLHHMVRFLVGTMVDAARGRRDPGDVARLLDASDNSETSAPAPAHALVLERVSYPADLYVSL